jgi:MFS transporter, putative metabolite transport protein
MGLDGFDLGIISVVLPSLTKDLHASAAWTGLIGASSLIGIFIGAPLFGRITDRFGRRVPFLIDILCFVMLGLLQAFAQTPAELFAVRLLLGLAIGAEYAIGPPMLMEFAPAEDRGSSGAWLEVNWYGGFFVSVVVGYLLLDVVGLDWRIVLATSVAPAIATLAMRHGLPESPRWLLSRGRRREAKAIVKEHVGDEAYFQEEFADESEERGSISDLLAPGYRGRLAMVCVFWACLVAPYFAIVTFAPTVFGALGLAEHSSTIAENGIGVLGAASGLFLLDRVGRRPMLIIPFWICVVCLAVVGFFPHASVVVLGVAFVVFAFCNSAAADLCGVYPNELFPTHLRTSAVGIAAASSRIGAAIGTFLLPIGVHALGIGPTMLIGAGFCVVGAVVCQLWAPETVGQTLTETAAPTPAAA